MFMYSLDTPLLSNNSVNRLENARVVQPLLSVPTGSSLTLHKDEPNEGKTRTLEDSSNNLPVGSTGTMVGTSSKDLSYHHLGEDTTVSSAGTNTIDTLVSTVVDDSSTYILSQDETLKIIRESTTGFVYLITWLARRRQFGCLNRYLLRHVNSRPFDSSCWYRYAISLYGNSQLSDAIKACWHAVQTDTIVPSKLYVDGSTESESSTAMRNHMWLSASLLAARCALVMKDSSTAMNYARAAVRLSLDSQFIRQCSQSMFLVDQRPVAYMLFSLSATQKAHDTFNFEDRKALHQLAMKSMIRSCTLSPSNPNVMFNLACARADLGDIESALEDIRPVLTNANPYHSESWHLLSLLLSSKRNWMESYRAIEQAVKCHDFPGLNLTQSDCMPLGTSNPAANVNNSAIANKNALRTYYKYKLKLTKAKILIKQNRISAPLEIFKELTKALFNERCYKMTKLPKSNKECLLFQPIQKNNAELVQFVNPKGPYHMQRALGEIRLELLLTLSKFYLSPNVSAPKYAFQCMEFALQFFGGNATSTPMHKITECNYLLSTTNDSRIHLQKSPMAAYYDKVLSEIYTQLGDCAQYNDELLTQSMQDSYVETSYLYNNPSSSSSSNYYYNTGSNPTTLDTNLFYDSNGIDSNIASSPRPVIGNPGVSGNADLVASSPTGMGNANAVGQTNTGAGSVGTPINNAAAENAIMEGVSYLNTSSYQKALSLKVALQYYQTSVTYFPQNIRALIGEATVEMKLGNTSDAKSFVDCALRIDASNSRAWFVLAKIQEQSQLYELASNSFLTALELERDEPIEPFHCVPRWY
ncbi:tetratricopeptide repeat protein tpr [Reticulomyxa filosa]|uniref:Tetratricopeptide repeat protein tpr n=1 Tax=Reticulomyxa filosa TaxID=46433 RepID=X6PGY9_RETFI|nr:tetratricopeptide repeat protein tpr [Reticulomyxa filosa]|eukprot:ETO36942.1 tetratricopeptide repeat protein tpr [Reticulomyxa filosa]